MSGYSSEYSRPSRSAAFRSASVRRRVYVPSTVATELPSRSDTVFGVDAVVDHRRRRLMPQAVER